MADPGSGGGFRVLNMRTVATAALTNGAFELIEDTRAQEMGPAPHVHRQSDEAFYVLGGRFAFTRGDEEVEALPGPLIFVPRGTRHSYRALEEGSRVLILYVPAARFDEFLREVDALLVAGLTSAEALSRLEGRFDSDPA